MARVKSFASPKLVMVFLALSVLMTASGVPFWDEVVVSGAHVWVFSSKPVSAKIQIGVISPVVFLLLFMWYNPLLTR